MTPAEVRNQLLKDYKEVFGRGDGGSPAQVRVIADLFEQCCETRTTFVPGDPYASAFNEGKRSIMLHIRDMVTTPIA